MYAQLCLTLSKFAPNFEERGSKANVCHCGTHVYNMYMHMHMYNVRVHVHEHSHYTGLKETDEN